MIRLTVILKTGFHSVFTLRTLIKNISQEGSTLDHCQTIQKNHRSFFSRFLLATISHLFLPGHEVHFFYLLCLVLFFIVDMCYWNVQDSGLLEKNLTHSIIPISYRSVPPLLCTSVYTMPSITLHIESIDIH